MNKENMFMEELKYIKDKDIRKDGIYLLNKLPDYFFEIPASSTGKYHPKFSLNEGGLVRHTKALVRIMKDLFDNPSIGDQYTSLEKDLLILAGILHDGFKNGKEYSKYTVIDHPIIAAKFVLEEMPNLNIGIKDAQFVSDAIKTHMGPWTKDYKGNEVLEKPVTKYQKMLHMCDYLASRKYLDIEFDNRDNIIS